MNITIEIPEEYHENLQDMCNAYNISESEFALNVFCKFFELIEGFYDADDIRKAEKAAEECKKHPERIVSHEEVRKQVLDNAD